MADVGTDHVLLPAYLVASGRCPRAIAVYLRPGPLAAARRNLQRYGVAARVELRQGDGLAVLLPGEAAVVVIAGLGGQTIAQILARHPQVARRARRLVLQPVRSRPALDRYLAGQGWAVFEREVAQGRKRYPLLVVDPGGCAPGTVGEELPCG